VIHDGDFQADFRGYRDGSLPCSDETFNNRKNLAQSFKPPFILTPGDNDWTDCHYVKSASYDPLERLAKLREIFFSGNDSFGQQTLSITRQSSDPKYSKFRENLRWTYGDVLCVTLHLVGSDNNFGRTKEMDAEYAERNAADLVWMKEGFDFAKRNGSKAIMIITQANPGFQNTWPEARFRRYMLNSPIKPPEKKTKSADDEFLAALETETLAFPRPVVLVHENSHIFRIDQPLLSSKTGRVIENFTRVETFGTPTSIGFGLSSTRMIRTCLPLSQRSSRKIWWTIQNDSSLCDVADLSILKDAQKEIKGLEKISEASRDSYAK
jgi:hypothetical protein